jgi:HlyD family secretion protein
MDKKIIRSPLKKYLKHCLLVMAVLTLIASAYGFSLSTSTGRSHNVKLTNVTITSVTKGVFIDALSLRGQVVPKKNHISRYYRRRSS